MKAPLRFVLRVAHRCLSPALLIVPCVVTAACAPVQAWERGNLAKPQMAVDPHPTQKTIRDHIHRSREASSAGDAAQRGAGCGCY